MGVESADDDQYNRDDLLGEDGILLQPGAYDVSDLGGAKGEILRAALTRVENEGDDTYTQYSGAVSDPGNTSDGYPDTEIIQYNPEEQ